jgi:DNA-binding IclR family transcriptional regulator
VRDEGCAQTRRAASVEVSSGELEFELQAGAAPIRVMRGDAAIDVALPVSQWRVLLDSECAPGVAAVSGDAVIVAVVRWGEGP